MGRHRDAKTGQGQGLLATLWRDPCLECPQICHEQAQPWMVTGSRNQGEAEEGGVTAGGAVFTFLFLFSLLQGLATQQRGD